MGAVAGKSARQQLHLVFARAAFERGEVVGNLLKTTDIRVAERLCFARDARRIDAAVDAAAPLDIPADQLQNRIRSRAKRELAMISRLFVLLASLMLFPAFGQERNLSKEKAAPADDAAETLSAIVRVRSKSVPNARSSATLGSQREGSGVLVREGYVATIGYLVIESESIEVTSGDGKSVPATLAGYDHASGFGLLKLLAPLAGRPLPMGSASALGEREPAMSASYGGSDGVNLVYVVSRRPFSGSWEYLLDSAIFTYPPVQNWSGASLISSKGELLGLGSLIVGDAPGTGQQAPGNMFVPVDLLKPIMDDLIARGRAAGAVRPWLGVNAEETRGRLFITRVSPDSPADKAGLKAGDLLIGVGTEEVSSLAAFYRKVWARGAAGVEVPIRVLQGVQVREVNVRSIDRMEYFRAKSSY
jgi:serine protease Do